MPYIKMKTSGDNRKSGAYKTGDILEVSASLADLYILNGKGILSSKEEFNDQVKSKKNGFDSIFNLTDEEVKTFDYSELNRKQLEAFAVRVGVDVELAEEAKNIDNLKEIIDAKLSEDNEF